MDRTGGDNAKCNKRSRERQLSYYFSHLWNIELEKALKMPPNKGTDVVKIGRRRKGRMKGE